MCAKKMAASTIEQEKAAEDIFKALGNGDTKVITIGELEDTGNDPVDHDAFVMSLFKEDELLDGKPLVHGLRRLARKLIGETKFHGPTQVFPSTDGEGIGRTTVVWTTTFEDGRTFSDVADCWSGNTDDMYAVHGAATAATKAEARVLRKALGIRTVAAEELTKKKVEDVIKPTAKVATGEYNEEGKMTDPQCNFLNSKAKQLNINLTAFLAESFNASPVSLSKSIASKAIDALSELQRNTSLITPSITGYSENWRNER